MLSFLSSRYLKPYRFSKNTGIPESFCAKPVLIGFNTPTVNPTTVPHKAMAVAVIES